MNKLVMVGAFSLIFIGSIILSSCGGTSDDESAATDTTAPTVSSTAPLNNAINVATDAVISVTFSEAVQSDTATIGTITVEGVIGTVSVSGMTATFTPSTDLAYGTTYTGVVKAAVKDLAGNAMTSDYTWSFTTVAAKGVRQLGMDVLSSTPLLSFEAGVAKARAAGVQFITLPVLWSQLTPTGPTIYDPTWVQNIKTMAAVCSANDLKLSLTIWTVDATGKHLPADLMTTRFTDSSQTMANRFVAVLDNLFITEGIDHTVLTSVQIGNELDGYNVSGDPDFSWSDYGAFLFDIKVLMASKVYSSLLIGFTGTLYGLNDQKAVFTAIAGAIDIVGATYYPLNIDYTVKDPSVVGSDIAAFVSNYSAVGKPLFLQEAGYPSGPQCNSSEEKQAQFVQNLFVAWDTYSTQITAVNFLRLNDVSMASAEATAVQYGIPGNASFIEFIRTLGFVAYDGTEKQAFQALSDNAHVRGW